MNEWPQPPGMDHGYELRMVRLQATTPYGQSYQFDAHSQDAAGIWLGWIVGQMTDNDRRNQELRVQVTPMAAYVATAVPNDDCAEDDLRPDPSPLTLWRRTINWFRR